MATSSFFYNGANAPEAGPTEPTLVENNGANPVKTSFFYGGTPGPDQSTVDELITALNERIDEAEGFSTSANSSASSATASAAAASASASSAGASAATALSLKNQTESFRNDSLTAVTEATALLNQANYVIGQLTISTNSPTGGDEGDIWFKVTY